MRKPGETKNCETMAKKRNAAGAAHGYTVGNPTRPMKSRSPLLLPGLVFLLAAVSASAHPLHGSAAGFTSGLSHPLTGWDHLLAMLAIGVWAAQLGGRARWGVPAAFVIILGLAAVAARGMGPVPLLEQGVAATVLALGLLIGTATRLPVAAGMALAAGFALFHGYAHGTELPVGGNFPAYGAGFMLTSAALPLAGLGLGLAATRFPAPWSRTIGWGVAAAGALALAT